MWLTLPSLLQIATPDAVFLLDLLTLCGNPPGNSTPGSSTPGSIAEPDNMDAGCSRGSTAGDSNTDRSLEDGTSSAAASASNQGQQQGGGGGGDGDALPPLQARLSALLYRLFGDSSIIKAGFGMQTDIVRLCESYPWLPCFGAEGPVPLR